MYHILIISFCSLFLSQNLLAQFYVGGGYNFAYAPSEKSQQIINTFNSREDHSLKDLNLLQGYRFTVGSYGRFTVAELSFGNIFTKQKSYNPNQLKENVEVSRNFSSVFIAGGYRPFRKQYFTFGLGLHLGLERLRYSFGGDYNVPLNRFAFAPEFFVDYALKFKFLLKKKQRKDMFFLLRIRPYYQLHTLVDLTKFEEEFNNNTLASNTNFEENWSHFGFRISILIPILKTMPIYDEPLTKRRKKKKRKRLIKQK